MTPQEKEITDISMGRPHVVILGAGASLAACANGDACGNYLPLMNNLIDVLDLKPILKKYNVNFSSNNFEEIYGNLYEDDKNKELVTVIEDRVWRYFSRLSLPSYPTIYDYLVLSLRNKDIIATFNWDPFLYTAWGRNYKVASLPHIVHLHGTVAMGYCQKDKVKGSIHGRCSKCGEKYTPSKLLFPIKKKNYTDKDFINSEWATLKECLKYAYMLTIFGYGAPTSDVEAITLMKEAWGPVEKRNLEEVEIIDTKPEAALEETWKDFKHTHHGHIIDSFYRSYIAQYPRRTCEALWSSCIDCNPYNDNNIPRDLSFEELYKWYEPLLKAEAKKD